MSKNALHSQKFVDTNTGDILYVYIFNIPIQIQFCALLL